MRNLKRALSLALASVMLMGMMVVGSSAASINDFKDADSISNKEAVAIATGLGIFDGYEDNTFKPENVVTRAEMAVIIAKILHGADIDPSNFAGAGKFTDVPAWAEGWVNLVASLGIIEGYGDGKFGPNDTVTTVQASTMLLKALGYYVESADALGADWQLEVTSKATALGLYGDLSLGMNAGLTRENVAELTFNALFAQRVAYDDYRGLYVKSNDRNVVVTNGTVDEDNTLAQNTFGLYSFEGEVVANGMTDEDLSESLKSAAQTAIKFTEDTDLDQNGKVEYNEGDVEEFKYETGLDMIGHAAKVYYKLVKGEPVVFTIVDQATLVAEISNNSNSTKLAKAANDAGFKKNSVLDILAKNYIVNYDMETTLGTGTYTWANGDQSTIGATDTTLNATKTLILISNSADEQVDYVIVLDQYLDTIADIDTDDDETEYDFTTANGRKLNIVTSDVEEDDYIIVTDIGNNGNVLVAEPAVIVNADITKVIAKSEGVDGTTTTGVVADGETYSKSKVVPYIGTSELDNTVAFDDVDKIGTYDLILDKDGKMIALATEPGTPNYAYVAQYGYYFGKTANDVSAKNILTALVYFADGTSGVYDVDLAKSNLGVTDATVISSQTTLNGNAADLFAGSKGIWNVKVQADGTVKIENAAAYGDTALATTEDAFAVGADLIKGHSTILTATNGNAVYSTDADTNASKVIYNNNDTIYFYVNGAYDADESDNGLTVKVITGIKNVKGFENTATAGIKNLWIKDSTRNTVKVMGIEDVVVGGAEGVYYYDTAKFEVEKAEGGYVITYTVYDKNGEALAVTYDNGGKYYKDAETAYDLGESKPDGFYKIGARDLESYVNSKLLDNANGPVYSLNGYDNDTANIYATKDDVNYVVNAYAVTDEYTDNVFDVTTFVGTIAEKAKVIDMTGNGIDSLADIKDAIEDGDSVYITYRYDEETYEAEIIYVSSYTPAGTAAPGRDNVNKGIARVDLTNTDGTVNVVMATGAYPAKVDVEVTSISAYTGAKTVIYEGTLTVAANGDVVLPQNVNVTATDGITYVITVDGVIAE